MQEKTEGSLIRMSEYHLHKNSYILKLAVEVNGKRRQIMLRKLYDYCFEKLSFYLTLDAKIHSKELKNSKKSQRKDT